jgi:hypothetical protein
VPWLVFFVVLVAFIYLRKFRIAVLVLTGVLVLFIAGVLIYSVNTRPDHKPDPVEEPKPITNVIIPQDPVVTADQLEFTDVVWLGPGSKLTGRVKNNSSHTVVGVKARIQLLDCNENNDCDVIGEREQNITPVIPAGQARDIEESLYFPGSTIRGKFQWRFTIIEVRGSDQANR